MDTKKSIQLGFGDVVFLTNKLALDSTNPKLNPFFLTKENFKNLNNPILGLSFKKAVSFKPNSQTYIGKAIYTNDKIVNNNYFEAFSRFFMTYRGEFENFNIGKIQRDPLDAKFFNKVLKHESFQLQSTGSLCQRFSFPKSLNVANTNILTGNNKIYQTPNINSIIINSLIDKNNFLYVSSRTGYAIYPQSFFTYKYPKYNYPTYVVPFVADQTTGNMEGLLVLATGTNESQKIVYVSPHDAKTQIYNTVVENIIRAPSKQQKDVTTRIDGQWMDIDYGSGYWISIGQGKYGNFTKDIIRSSNGKNWSTLSNVLPSIKGWSNIAFGTGRWVTLPSYDTVSFPKGATSTDNGTTWNEIDINGRNGTQYFPMTQFKKIVFNGSNRWVILGRDSSDRTLTSTDGVNWTGNAPLPTLGGASDYTTLEYGDNKWVTLNNFGGGLYSPPGGAYSTDGINWQTMSIPTAQYYVDLKYGNGRFIGLPSYGNTYITSTNGTGWSTGQFPRIRWGQSPGFPGYEINVGWAGLTYDGTEWVVIPQNHFQFNPLSFASGFKSTDGLNWSGFELSSSTDLKNWRRVKSNIPTETTLIIGSDYIRRLSAPNFEYKKVAEVMSLNGVNLDSKHINSGNIFSNGFVRLNPTEKVNLLSGEVNFINDFLSNTGPDLTDEEKNFLFNYINERVNEIYQLSGQNKLDEFYECNELEFVEDTGVYSGYNGSLDFMSSGCGRILGQEDLDWYFSLSGDISSGLYDNSDIFNINLESLIPYTEYKINNNYLKQTTPLKDTWFYKIYSGVYATGNGLKSFNTGTWDGVIPSGANLYIEYISTNDIVGSNNTEFLITYTGYGSNDENDITLRSINPFETGKDNNSFTKTFISKSYLSTYNAEWRNKLKFQEWKRNKYAFLYKDFAYTPSNQQNKIFSFISGKADFVL
jgi:hypothetical protein